MTTEKCFACGGTFKDMDGPVHAYMDSTPGCWAAFGEVLAKEYSDQAYFKIHRLTVDLYAIQHPGKKDSRQAIQSVGFHLIRLYLFLEKDLQPEHANAVMVKAAKSKHLFTYLEPPQIENKITVADVAKAQTPEEHITLVKAWAENIWETWAQHHDTIKKWAQLNQ